MEGNFKSGGAFVLTAVGAAVGLGNVFRFPALACLHGGGFVAAYLLLAILLGLPLFLSEVALGRRLGGAEAFGRGRGVSVTGRLCGANAFVIMTAYLLLTSLVASSAAGSVGGIGLSKEALPLRILFFLLVFCLAVWLFLRGKISGAVSTAGVALSCTAVFLLALCFLFSDPVGLLTVFKIRWEAFLKVSFWRDLVGQVFFSLSVMTGVLTVFGERLGERANLPLCGLGVVLTDFAVSLAATFIYAGVRGDKSGLLSAFQVYPAAFKEVFGGLGDFAAFVFFGSLFLLCVDSVLAYMQSVFSLLAGGRVGRFAPLLFASCLVGVALALEIDLFALTFLDSTIIPLFTLLVGVFEGLAVSKSVKEGLLLSGRSKGLTLSLRLFAALLLPACLISLIILEIFR